MNSAESFATMARSWARRQIGHLRGEPVDRCADGERLWAVVEQPASGAVDEAAQIQRHAVRRRHGHSGVARRPDLPPHVADAEDLVGGDEAPHRVDRSDADVLGDAVGVADACGVDEVVHQHRRDDLPAQLVRADLTSEAVPKLVWEVVGQPGREDFLIG
jgi:hypothetical protein